MCDTLDLEVLRSGSAIVEEHHRALEARKELFELKDLAPVPQGRIGQHAHLGEGIEHHTPRFNAPDLGNQCIRRPIELDFGGMEKGALAFAANGLLDPGKIEKVNAIIPIQLPAVRPRYGKDLIVRLG